MTVLIDDKIRSVVKEEATVIFDLKALFKDKDDTEITSDKFSANLKFKPAEEEEDEEEVVAPAAEATVEETIEEVVEEIEEEPEPESEVVAPPAPVKVEPVKKNNPEVKGPITIRASVVSGTGDIKVEFSRPIKIEFSDASRRNLKANDYWSRRRWLAGDDYTAEEKEQLAKIIKI